MPANLMERPGGLKLVPLALVAALASGACGRAREPEPAAATIPLTLPIEVLRDTGRGASSSPAPGVEAWLERVSVTPPPIVTPRSAASVEPQLPDAAPESTIVDHHEPPPLAIDPGLKPPIPKSSAPLRLPSGYAEPATVELDVEVNERGDVADARWAGGSTDPELVEAALECARRMRFYPALRAGRPVAVWCRQRFEFAAR